MSYFRLTVWLRLSELETEMAALYVRSTDGSDADNGTTWALAKATLSGAAAIDAAGDVIYLSQAHAATALTSQTVALAGTEAAPTKVICGNDSAEPPTSVATASEATAAGADYTISGNAYVRGLSVSVGTSASTTTASFTCSGNITLDQCAITLVNIATLSRVILGGAVSSAGSYKFQDVDVTLGNKNTHGVAAGAGLFVWNGGSISGVASYTTGLIQGAGLGRTLVAVLSGVDFSGVGTGSHLCGTVAASPVDVTFRNCKLPAGWTGSLFASSPVAGMRCEMHNCDSGDTNYRLWTQDLAGTVKSETTIVRTGGANDGTTGLSWQMVSAANAEYPLIDLASPEIVIWNEITGSAKTITIEVITDNVTLTDEECWLEVQYLGTSGFPLGVFLTDAKSDVLATAANQTTSSATWTTTGLTTPVKQKLEVTFTPQEKGFVHAKVMLAKASTTVYVDPKATVA